MTDRSLTRDCDVRLSCRTSSRVRTATRFTDRWIVTDSWHECMFEGMRRKAVNQTWLSDIIIGLVTATCDQPDRLRYIATAAETPEKSTESPSDTGSSLLIGWNISHVTAWRFSLDYVLGSQKPLFFPFFVFTILFFSHMFSILFIWSRKRSCG